MTAEADPGLAITHRLPRCSSTAALLPLCLTPLAHWVILEAFFRGYGDGTAVGMLQKRSHEGPEMTVGRDTLLTVNEDESIIWSTRVQN